MGKAGEQLAESAAEAFKRLSMADTGPVGDWLLSCTPILERQKKQRAIEEAITAFHADADEAAEILDALTASLKLRYEDHAEDAIRIADEFRAALAEVEPLPDGIDEMTLAKEPR